MADNRLIVALDVHSMSDVSALVKTLGDSVSYYKVGMELFYRVGAEVLTYLHGQGKSIFLDLKLHDIPNTVAEGLFSLMNLHADMLNVHASGGYEMMKTAVERVREKAAQDGIPAPKLIAVTILTSIGGDDWKEMGFSQEIREQVIRPDFLIVTPGIRPAGADINDQSRIATPFAALRNGATHLVVGRPIRAAKDSRAAAEAIIREMERV